MSCSLFVNFVESKVLPNASFNPLSAGRILRSAMFLVFLCAHCKLSGCAVHCYSIVHHFCSIYFMLFNIWIIDYWICLNGFRIVHVRLAMHLRIDFFRQHYPLGARSMFLEPNGRVTKIKDGTDHLFWYHPQLLTIEMQIIACCTKPNQTGLYCLVKAQLVCFNCKFQNKNSRVVVVLQILDFRSNFGETCSHTSTFNTHTHKHTTTLTLLLFYHSAFVIGVFLK